MAQKNNIVIIAALGKNRELGKQGKLLWSISEDLKRFKALTMGNVVIMGRKTFESLPPSVRPLPGRVNIVVTRNADFPKGNYLVASSVEDAIRLGEGVGTEKIFVIGGGEIYSAALPFTNQLELTLVDAEDSDADTFFPAYERFQKVVYEKKHDDHVPPYTFITLQK